MKTLARTAALLAAATLTLAGCSMGGGEETPEPAATGMAAWPSCDEVWVAGETLPADYEGCTVKGNEVGGLVAQPCDSGVEYAVYADQYYGVPGKEVHERQGADLYMDKKFQNFSTVC